MQRHRETLTPQMLDYDEFNHPARTNHQPYLMYFHRPHHRSGVVNTDRLGFRYSQGLDSAAAVADDVPAGPVNLLGGSSTAFGIGATRDATTIPSRLWTEYAPTLPWLNFAGRGYNSAQELLLFLLHQHLLPPVREIVLFTGVNNLALSRLPQWQRGEHGAFHFCGEYFEQMRSMREKHRKATPRRHRHGPEPEPSAQEEPAPLEEAIEIATALTARHLDNWRLLAEPFGARLSFVLQPFTSWMQREPVQQERTLCEELDVLSEIPYEKLYGDIVSVEAGKTYADALRYVCEERGIRFLDLNPALADAAAPDDWLFVDRRHFTDTGSDLVSRLMAERLELN